MTSVPKPGPRPEALHMAFNAAHLVGTDSDTVKKRLRPAAWVSSQPGTKFPVYRDSDVRRLKGQLDRQRTAQT